VSIACWVFAAGVLVAAFRIQNEASQPIGEGQVFVADADSIGHLIDNRLELDEAVRHARNSLAVEAVSIVDPSGEVVASTSDSLMGVELTNPLLAFGAQSNRFVALASPVSSDIAIDGVVEWPSGSVLYQVISPLSDGRSSLVHYDLSEMLERRARPDEVQPETIRLMTLGAVFAMIGAAVIIGHTRVAKRYRDVARESELLRQQSHELELANVELQKARHAAEGALAIAEEKIRVRSDFVLMINHELRTPLTSVVTGARLLKEGDLEAADSHQVIDAMVADGTRLQEIIDQILAVARLENQGLTSDLKVVSLDDLRASLGSSHAAIDEIDVRSHRTGIRVHTDLTTLRLAVASLVDNARTHGAQSVKVGLSAEQVIRPMVEVGKRPKVGIFITVTDDGPGIPEDFLPRIFEKFEKSSFSSGTGLGLYMVRIMIEALGGSVAVSTSPFGTVFQIALPAVLSPIMAATR